MKIAVFSNLWPPLFRGGYELGAAHVVRELRRRGHEVRLFSAHEYHLVPSGGAYERAGHAASGRGAVVDVGLCVFGSLLRYARRRGWAVFRDLLRTMRARRRCRAALNAFRPDCLLAFNPAGVLAPVLDDFGRYARRTGATLHCYVSDHWLSAWPSEHPAGRLMRAADAQRWNFRRGFAFVPRSAFRLLQWIGLAPERTPRVDRYYYCSKFIQRLGVPRLCQPCPTGNTADTAVAHKVIPWGVRGVARHGVPAGHFQTPEPLTLVYAGQVLEHKGLGVLIDALPLCRARHPLVVIGDDRPAYADRCKKRATELGVLEQIRFVGKKEPREMPALLGRSGHVLAAPALWDEPFSIGVLEGMGVGLPVVASDTGGTAEAIRDGDSGFLFPRGDSAELAAIIDRLEGDRELCLRVSRRARRRVLRRYRIDRMVDRLEAAITGARPKAAPQRKAAAAKNASTTTSREPGSPAPG